MTNVWQMAQDVLISHSIFAVCYNWLYVIWKRTNSGLEKQRVRKTAVL